MQFGTYRDNLLWRSVANSVRSWRRKARPSTMPGAPMAWSTRSESSTGESLSTGSA